MPTNQTILIRKIQLLTDFISHVDFSPRGRLYLMALASLGYDATPNDDVPDEYACAETVNALYRKCFGVEIGGGVLTTTVYQAIVKHPNFVSVGVGDYGDILVSPTGYGNWKLKNGHIGICGKNGIIMSNDSATGLLQENYTIATWKARYVDIGGFPMKYFRRI